MLKAVYKTGSVDVMTDFKLQPCSTSSVFVFILIWESLFQWLTIGRCNLAAASRLVPDMSWLTWYNMTPVWDYIILYSIINNNEGKFYWHKSICHITLSLAEQTWPDRLQTLTCPWNWDLTCVCSERLEAWLETCPDRLASWLWLSLKSFKFRVRLDLALTDLTQTWLKWLKGLSVFPLYTPAACLSYKAKIDRTAEPYRLKERKSHCPWKFPVRYSVGFLNSATPHKWRIIVTWFSPPPTHSASLLAQHSSLQASQSLSH